MVQPTKRTSEPPPNTPAWSQSLSHHARGPGRRRRTYHTLHLLGDVIALLAVGSLGLCPGLSRTLGAELQVSSQGAAPTLVPAQGTRNLSLRPQLGNKETSDPDH